MARPRILCVFGTRPEAIKMAPVVRALNGPASGLQPVLCVTEQHQEMLDQVLGFFDLRPDHGLAVMGENQTPSEVAARILERFPPVLAAERPAAVLVQGATATVVVVSPCTSTAAGRSASSTGGNRSRMRAATSLGIWFSPITARR